MTWFADQGDAVQSVDAETMPKLDRTATSLHGKHLLQMMENAGWALAEIARQLSPSGSILVLCGRGGNGGGGLAAVRHLGLCRREVGFALSAVPAPGTAADTQLGILEASGRMALRGDEVRQAAERAGLVVDALIGYSSWGANLRVWLWSSSPLPTLHSALCYHSMCHLA